VTHDAEGAALVRSVIDLGHALHLTSIAEGVEHDDQLVVLEELGCDNVQGFLFARPMRASDVADALTRLLHEAALPAGRSATAPLRMFAVPR
jgi:EAL domain-containing protein (putative c-di-GMP-specific phosphodiesterase class I)